MFKWMFPHLLPIKQTDTKRIERLFSSEELAHEYITDNRIEDKDFNIQDSNGDTLLHRYPTLIFDLIPRGANPNICNRKGDSPLIIAMRAGVFSMFLVNTTHADLLNKVYSDGQTILTTALKMDSVNLRIIAKLLEKGANPLQPNRLGQTPFDVSAMYHPHNQELHRLLRRYVPTPQQIKRSHHLLKQVVAGKVESNIHDK
ncbi:MAG: ankyrin repeat domain-containing protein [Alphaproteobacteria bacterium]|nr:ankyrin repeat domain-containing protein [Alphaproteobacteria bacterium]